MYKNIIKITCARFCRYLAKLHSVAPGCVIKPSIEIDKPLVAYRFRLDNIEYLIITTGISHLKWNTVFVFFKFYMKVSSP